MHQWCNNDATTVMQQQWSYCYWCFYCFRYETHSHWLIWFWLICVALTKDNCENSFVDFDISTCDWTYGVIERTKIVIRAWLSVTDASSVSRLTISVSKLRSVEVKIIEIIPLDESFRSRDGFLDFRESVITLPILLIRFSVLDPFRRSLRDGLANDDPIDGDSSRFLVCFLHSITRSLRGWITPSKALKYFLKSWSYQTSWWEGMW